MKDITSSQLVSDGTQDLCSAGRKQSPGPQLVEAPRDDKRRTPKRRDTHLLAPGVRAEMAETYPRWTASSEQVANRTGFTRLAVVDSGVEALERRVRQIEIRMAAMIRRAA